MKGKDWENCIVCGKQFLFEWETCCSGFECGCQGKTTEPPVCSEQCDEKFWKSRSAPPDSPEQSEEGTDDDS